MADEHIKRIIFKEYTTPPNPCSYYEDSRDMMMAIEHPVSCTSSELYNHLALHGCRRQGTIIIKPAVLSAVTAFPAGFPPMNSGLTVP